MFLKKSAIFILFFFIIQTAFGQIKKPICRIDNTLHNYGTVENIGTLLSEFKVYNKGTSNLFVMKADAPRGFLVDIKNKTIAPGDSSILTIKYKPKEIGPFEETVRLFSNSSDKPIPITLKGEVLSFAADPMACYSFRSTPPVTPSVVPLFVPHKGTVIDKKTGVPVANAKVKFTKGNFLVTETTTEKKGTFEKAIPLGLYKIKIGALGYRDTTLQSYINKNTPPLFAALTPLPKEEKVLDPTPVDTSKVKALPPVIQPDISEISEELPEDKFTSNNIVFLIDKSGSMKDSLKLPLLKSAINTLILAVRKVDKIGVVTYSDSAKIYVPSTNGQQKDSLAGAIDLLKAKGYTRANKGLALAYNVIKDNYIQGGNNQLILATDGIFKLTEEDQKLISSDPDKKIKFTILAFGTDKWALDRLRLLAQKNNGKFILISDESTTNALLEEVKANSAK